MLIRTGRKKCQRERERERAGFGGTSGHIDETNYNTLLAALLKDRLPGWGVSPQRAKTSLADGGDKKPDVLAVSPDDVPVVLEAKYDRGGNRHILADQTEGHIGRKSEGAVIEQSVAVLYPDRLSRIEGDDYLAALGSARLQWAGWRKTDVGAARFPVAGWLSGGLDELADFVEINAVSEQRTAKLVWEFSRAVTDTALIMDRRFPGVAEAVKQEKCVQTDQMAASLLLNALIFHYQVARHHPEISSPTNLHAEGKATQLFLLKEWDNILEINYWPIFDITSAVLRAVDDEKTAQRLLERLIETASRMARANAHTIQNLTGQVFGTLLADRKFLASFYTLPAPAALLAELAVSRLRADWSDPEAVTSLRVADFSCGTGALLAAVYQRISSRVRRSGADDSVLHARMLEDVFVGCDIMPAAVHITAATLSSAHPSVDYTKTETHVMPFGPMDVPSGVSAGSLDLLEREATDSLFGDGSLAVAAKGEPSAAYSQVRVPHGSCDLVIMNPPYTSPTNHKLEERQATALPQFAAFGMGNQTQKKISQKVKKMAGALQASVRNGYAGLGTDFFDLAHLKVKPGGTVAFVLPASFAAGSGWRKMRELIDREYEDVCVISSSAGKDEDRRFSSDTNMGEVLLIATRRAVPRNGSAPAPGWRWVNLAATPETVAEGLAMAADIAGSAEEEGVSVGKLGEAEWGFSMRCRPSSSAPIMMRSWEVAQTLLQLTDPDRPGLALPRINSFAPLPITRLGELGIAGPVDRALVKSRLSDTGAFDFFPHPGGETDFPALWNHNHAKETRLTVHPDRHGRPAPGKAEQAARWWKTATRLHFNRDFRFTSQPLAACLTPEPALGGTAWPSFILHPKDKPAEERLEWAYPMVLWANTTLGLMCFYITGSRTQAGRSRITISRLPELPVLDVRALSRDQLRLAETIFHRFRNREFMPANQVHQDPTRRDLDQAVLAELLNCDADVLERTAVIRDQWRQEPHLR